jgi:hypothetical protein
METAAGADLFARILGRKPEDFLHLLGEIHRDLLIVEDVDDRQYLEYPERGISIVIEDSIAKTIQLHAQGTSPDYAQYSGSLPGNLQFSSSRGQARRVFGAPERSQKGTAGEGILGGYLNPWDRFNLRDRSVHLEYTANATGIRLVSISLLAKVPERPSGQKH